MLATEPVTFGSVFTGFGGADLGAIAAGLVPLYGLERDEICLKVARANDIPVRLGDAMMADPLSFPETDVDHFSPPCQPHTQGKRDDSSPLAMVASAIPKWIEARRPRGFSLEQVPGFVRSRYYADIFNTLESFGYSIATDVVNAADYGVPQNRRRLIILASRCRPVSIPRPLPSKVSWDEVTRDLWDALEPVDPITTQTKAFGPLSQWGDETFLIQRIGSPGNSTGRKPYRCFLGEQANTIRALGGDRHWRQCNVYRDGRLYSVPPRFYARLQTFPDSYGLDVEGVLNWQLGKGIGNAYPCQMARAMLSALKSAIV